MSGIFELKADQAAASNPTSNVWLSASAGTGKTQVLTARVYRLLLHDRSTRPENILCLTYTRAGAAEMANRINSQLAEWVRKSGSDLAGDLRKIGVDPTPENVAHARRLFANLLDAPGGGLQIMTIHSFCQRLLASFPVEAGLIPGFAALDEADGALLRKEALASLVVDARDSAAAGDPQAALLLDAIGQLGRDMGEDAARAFLEKCASEPRAMEAVPEVVDERHIYVRRLVGLDFYGDASELLLDELSDAKLPDDLIAEFIEGCRGWGAATGNRFADQASAWLALPIEERAQRFDELRECWTTTTGTVRKLQKGNDALFALAEHLFDWSEAIASKVALAAYSDRFAEALRAGKAYSARYAAAKRADGKVDFDDLIRKAADLLKQRGIGEWIRFKLDQRIEHVLVDESQDSNKAQWDIVRKLVEDYAAGLSTHDEKRRTLFSVGDFKQAIFSFQGTSPEQYRAAFDIFEAMFDVPERRDLALQRHSLTQSFRTTEPVLNVVDALIETVGSEAFGPIGDDIPDHITQRGTHGQVVLLAPFVAADSDAGEDEESWLSDEKLAYARSLSRYVAGLIADPPWLETENRAMLPGDILILLRSRSDLASLLVARLHEENVPVEGVDRLQLAEPLAVADVMAAIRFVLQPDDDLTLAELLVSPLVGWSQDQLMEAAVGRGKSTLWAHIAHRDDLEHSLEPLRDLLDRADYMTAHDFIEHILSGPIQGRKKLIARMGDEVRDPIGELTNAALRFERDHAPSLQAFAAWFEQGEIEVKRESAEDSNEVGPGKVRLMTVHGSKGLQAPVVILADMTRDPARMGTRSLDLLLDEAGDPDGDEYRLPMLPARKAEAGERLGEVVEMQAQRDAEEHMRLLYVALTRAQDILVMGGVQGARQKELPGQSWYVKVQEAMAALGSEDVELAGWPQGALVYGELASSAKPKKATAEVASDLETPAWLHMAAPVEARPPRPLAPSATDEDDDLRPPPGEAMRRAARRGNLLHALFERLPEVPEDDREAAARSWLARQAKDLSDGERADIVDTALAVMSDDRRKRLFMPESLAEIPIAAVVGETVVSGQVDRLIVTADRIEIVDFKTGLNIPDSLEAVPKAYIRQMAWYAAALETIYPDREVSASLLYTSGPQMIALPPSLLRDHYPQ